MVFQNYALYPYLNVYENIAFGLRARKVVSAEVDRKVRRAAEMLDIAQLLERFPRELSGGQRQRVAIGRAIVRDALLFLFDEPLSNLDAQLRDEMRSEIKRLHQELGATMIYVTHDQIEAMTLADRIVLMNGGLIEQSGSPLELYERPQTRFVAGFLGSPKINFLNATLELSGIVFADGQTVQVPESAINRYKAHLGNKVVFAIRPQHIDRGGSGLAGNISGRIDLVQPTGARTYVTFAIGQEPVMAELDAHDAGRPGDEFEASFDLDHFILIEPESGKVLGNGS